MDLIVATITDFSQYAADNLKLAIDRAKAKNQKVFPLVINSPGGSVFAMNRMIDDLQASGMKIVTILNGVAMSAGSVLFAIGHERYMSPHSTIMIHQVSSWTMGTVASMESDVEFSKSLNIDAFRILNSQCGKEDGFFENLLKENNNADLYIRSDKALEYGLATQIKIPSPEEIRQAGINESRSPYNNFKMFLDMSEASLEAKINDTELPEEVKTLDLTALMAKLPPEERKPIEALQAQLSTASNEVSTLKNKVTELETQVTNTVNEYEQKMAKAEDESDKAFLDNLLHKEKRLSKERYDKEIVELKNLSKVPSAKASYKNMLASLPSVVEGEVPDNTNANANKASQSDIEGIKEYAQKNNINLLTTAGYQQAAKGYKKSKGGN
jgi:ATP-dependent protease ClpP protease subunit